MNSLKGLKVTPVCAINKLQLSEHKISTIKIKSIGVHIPSIIYITIWIQDQKETLNNTPTALNLIFTALKVLCKASNLPNVNFHWD